MTEDGRKIIEFQTENFKCEASKVGAAKIGNEEIPVYDCIINPKTCETYHVIFGYVEEDEISDDCDYGPGDYMESEYEQEALNLVQKLLDELETKNFLFLAFFSSKIARLCWNVEGFSCVNPVKGFIQTCDEDGYNWLTWVESPAVAVKCAKDAAFQIAFEKWALAKFLKIVFGRGGFGNGYISVGKLNVEHRWSTVAGWVTNLPIDYVTDILPNRSLTKKELERLYELLAQR